MNAGEEHPPVMHTVEVPVPPAAAFAVFVERIGEWWPLRQFAVHDDAATAVIEPSPGGAVYEVTRGGLEAPWGSVVASDPPHVITIAWRLPSATPPTLLVVRMSEAGTGSLVTVEHSGWSTYGPAAGELRASYDEGWPAVLECFAAIV